MGSLEFKTALRLGTISESETGFTLLNLEAVREVHRTNDLLTINDSIRANNQDIKDMYGSWVVHEEMLPSYDVFISHRWRKEDDKVVDQLYDSFLGHVVGTEMRGVKVFYDKIRLRDGLHIQREFGKSLINSTIFVPIVCTTAMRRMVTHDDTCEDNVLGS